MNKDLDERLVPNGEYRDALNIQVSTSEGSDVGTVQNILGNSLIPGQDFISGNAVCVGSIADEKNDKLYYFITRQELITYPDLDGVTNWSTINPGTTIVGSGTHTFNNNGVYSQLSTSHHPLQQGNKYKLTVTVDSISPGAKITINQAGYPIVSTTGNTGTFTVDYIPTTAYQTTNPVTDLVLYMAPYSSTTNGAVISYVSLKEAGDYIVEYDSTTNTITPVLVDMTGDVLKFNEHNLITGINIIDDLLFWTDNENEPKKINIQRSIEGTDPSGTIHTVFINNKRTGGFGDIREEHITVIKKAPKVAPTIELISERPLDGTKIHTGVMKITTAPTIPMVQLTNNYQNESSLWVHEGSQFNHLYDFSTLKVGDEIHTQIETDINGDSGFELSWEVGDTILFKEFGGENFDEPPEIPIVDYTIKATVGSLSQKWIGTPPTFRFTDEELEFAQNGDFTIPDANGDAPRYYDLGTVGNGWSYNPGTNAIFGNNVYPYSNISQTPSTYFTNPNTNPGIYIVSFTLSGYNLAPLEGAIRILIAPSGGGGDAWNTPFVTTAGTHTFTIDTSTAPLSTSTNYTENRWYFESGPTSPDNFKGIIENVSIIEDVTTGNEGNATIRCHIQSIKGVPPNTLEGQVELKYAVDKLASQEKIFEFKFPRFAYRYQYEDREYSTMSPFSQIAFVPGSFNYHPKKGYNLGMTNRVSEIGIKNFTQNVPDGVVAIDILYKDDSSPNIYIVDTIKPKHNPLGVGSNIWDEDGDPTKTALVVTSEQISQMLPSNQLLRLWDAVPKKALAQDVSGNRIIYGNYTQGFDLKAGDTNALEDYYPDFNFNVMHDDNTSLNPKKSIKSLREYQLGVVFVDEYGRETPVISNRSGTYKLDKLEAEKINQIQVDFGNEKYPENMKYFKFFIKETSGEYYNLAMDRYYDAEDGQRWLSFPSSDRNKLDIDTFLILKKGLESNEMVSAPAKYKILDIQNEAPDFIKFDKQLIVESKPHVASDTDVFGGNLDDAPRQGHDDFKMNYDQFNDSSGSNLHEVKDNLYIEFTNSTNKTSERYRISKIATDYIDGVAGTPLATATYSVQLDKKLGDDVNFITDDPLTGLNASKIDDGAIVNIYRYTKENSSKFDGRFFVKINVDSTFNENITVEEVVDIKYRTVLSKKLYYLSDDNSLHSSALTGQTHGMYNASEGDFGRFAPFFRNYNKVQGYSDKLKFNGTNIDVGQYSFGNHTNAMQELKWITTGSSDQTNTTSSSYSGFSRTGAYPGAKVADSHGWGEGERNGVFNDKGEQEKGEVWFIDGGKRFGRRDGQGLYWHQSGNISHAVPATSGGISIASSSSGNTSFNIAIGGIYNDTVNFGAGGVNDNYFTVGESGGNANYDGVVAQNLVGKFYPGQKLRFKEDPTGEVYTIQPNVNTTQYLRWFNTNKFEYWGYESAAPATWLWRDTDPLLISSTYSWQEEYDFTQFATQLSPNFSKGWVPRVLNSSGDSAVNWDPTGDPGPIDGGLELSISHHSSLSTITNTTDSSVYVVVDSLSATNHDGTTHLITTGMILTSHSNAGTEYEAPSTTGKEYLAIKEIVPNSTTEFQLHLTGYSKILAHGPVAGVTAAHNIFAVQPANDQTMVFKQPKMNGYSQYSVNRLNAQWPNLGGIMAIGYNLEFVEAIESEQVMPSNPAIWETEPKESTDLDIYYEASGLNPLKLEDDTYRLAIPLLSAVEHIGVDGENWIEAGTTVEDVVFDGTDWTVILASPSDDPSLLNSLAHMGSLVTGGYIAQFDKLRITKPNGDIVIVEITGWPTPDADGRTSIFKINSALYGDKTQYNLNWHNCYSFGNGVESNRIRDNFNLPYISNGVKVSTTLEEGNGEEHRKYGLIYSGIYNSNSSVNNLNQFIAAEKITKDINPVYGSIQKLHSRDSDLVALCEDKCLRILANKDAVYNADGNPQLTANENVLGQTIPFSGEYGISKNPESFASESYRVYFTDKVRGAVMRLSKDGLTPISMYGMKDWFKDNLKLSTELIGSYDDRKDEYNITLADRKTLGDEIIQDGKLEDSTHWFLSGTGVMTEDYSGEGVLLTSVPGVSNQYSGFIQVFDLIDGKNYQFTVEFSDIDNGGTSGNNYLIGGDPYVGGENTYRPFTHPVATSGLHSHVFTFDETQNNNLSSMRIYIQMTNGDAYTKSIRVKNVSLKEIITDPITVSFKEDVKGWVSFKSFVLENGLSVANDYYTILGGKLYKHHIENANRNNFYNTDYNSSVNVILNDGPGSVKSFHTLDYEGSQSRVEGIKSLIVIETTDPAGSPIAAKFLDWSVVTSFLNITGDGSGTTFEAKVYRNNILIEANITLSLVDPILVPPTSFDFEIGDVITTQLQEDYVSHFNMTPKNGWYVSGIETNKEKGNIREFIEKEGKWFNYIKGVDSDITSDTDFGAFDIQGLGIIESVDSNSLTISGGLNASLQVGDTIYYEQPTLVLEDNILDVNLFTSVTTDLTGSGNDGYTIVNNTTVTWSPTANTPSGLNYFNNLTTENITVGDTYLGTLEVSNYNGTGTLGFSSSSGVSSSLKLYADGVVSAYFVATTNSKPDFFARDTNSGTMKGSIQKVVPGGMGGFTQIESNQLQKAGVITVISDNIITVDNSGTLPLQNDYCMFVKNHAINTSSLVGYFADVKFENNSTGKIELFSVGSEITQSSK